MKRVLLPVVGCVMALCALFTRKIEQEALIIGEPTCRSTVRTDRCTAVQSYKYKDSQQLGMSKFPAVASLLFVVVREMGLEPTRPVEHRHLKPACLPIPALSRIKRFVL